MHNVSFNGVCSREITFAYGHNMRLEGGRTSRWEEDDGRRRKRRRRIVGRYLLALTAASKRAEIVSSSIFLCWISHSHFNNVVTCINNPRLPVFLLNVYTHYTPFAGPLIPQPHNKCLPALPQALLLPLTHVCFFEYLATITRHWSLPSLSPFHLLLISFSLSLFCSCTCSIVSRF